MKNAWRGVSRQRPRESLQDDAAPATDDVTHWPIPRLIDYIVSTHHAYVRTAMPVIVRQLATIHEAHGARHPELARVVAYFDQMRGDLEQHLPR